MFNALMRENTGILLGDSPQETSVTGRQLSPHSTRSLDTLMMCNAQLGWRCSGACIGVPGIRQTWSKASFLLDRVGLMESLHWRASSEDRCQWQLATDNDPPMKLASFANKYSGCSKNWMGYFLYFSVIHVQWGSRLRGR